MADTQQIEATARPRAGKGAARAVRREGKVPAVIYGDKKEPETIAIDANEIKKLFNAGGFMSHVFEVKCDGKTSRVLPRDVQFHPVTDRIIHIDFLRMARGAMVTVDVHVEFINEDKCRGLSRGGTLNVVRHTVELECPNDAIPESIVADLEGLDIGDSVHISAVKLPDRVTPTISDRDFTIATISGAMTQETAEDEADGGDAADDAASGDKDDA